MTETTETVDNCNPTEEAHSIEEKVSEEILKEKVEEKQITSHENGSVRLRKTKRNASKQENNASKKNQEIKKILAAKASGKSKDSGGNFIATMKNFLTGNVVWISFIIVVILAIVTRFYNLSDPPHIW